MERDVLRRMYAWDVGVRRLLRRSGRHGGPCESRYDSDGNPIYSEVILDRGFDGCYQGGSRG